MKKIILILCVVFGLGLVGCSLPTEEIYTTEETKKETVVETPKEETLEEADIFTVKKLRILYSFEDYWPEQRDMKFTYVFYISTGGKSWKVVWNKDVEYRIEGSSIYIDVYVPYDAGLEPEVFDFYAPSFDTFSIVEVT